MGLRVIASVDGEHRPAVADLLREADTVDVADARDGAPVLVTRRVTDPEDAAHAASRWSAFGLSGAWLVDEREQWDGAAGVTGLVPGYKQVSFLRAVPGVDFGASWAHHASLARVHHPTLWRYTQNVVLDTLLPGTPPVDGIGELTMRLRQDFIDRMYDSEEGRRTIGADVRTFIDLTAGWRLRTREYRPPVERTPHG